MTAFKKEKKKERKNSFALHFNLTVSGPPGGMEGRGVGGGGAERRAGCHASFRWSLGVKTPPPLPPRLQLLWISRHYSKAL